MRINRTSLLHKNVRLWLGLTLCTLTFGLYAANTANNVCNESQNQGTISPCNYLQNPFGLVGYSSKGGPNGSWGLGLSGIFNNNIRPQGTDTWGIGNVVEFWGQTPRWGGFALGGAISLANIGSSNLLNPNDIPSQQMQHTTEVIIPNQAYLNYQYKNVFDIAAGNIVLNTPWANSAASLPPYILTNSFQGVTANLQVLPNLLLTGFGIFSYQLYPNNYWDRGTNYNIPGGIIQSIGSTPTPGSLAIGAVYQPTRNDTVNLWLYQFYNYVDMWYADNDWKLELSKNVSMNFGIQGVMQTANGSNLVGQQTLEGTNIPAGTPNGNAVGVKWDINVPHDTISFSYNNVFGPTGSFLNGGLITPYTYLFETDPLYTTPALGSMAELGSGSAFTFRNKTKFLDNSLQFNVSYSVFWINKIFPTQANLIEEYNVVLKYNIPHTKFSTLGRLVYYQQPDYAGGNTFQPRIIVTYVF